MGHTLQDTWKRVVAAVVLRRATMCSHMAGQQQCEFSQFPFTDQIDDISILKELNPSDD